VLAALRQALPTLGLELNMRETTVLGPGLVPAASPLSAARDHGDPAGHMEHGGGKAHLGRGMGAGHPAY